MQVCAIHQPNFFPWLGYFEKMRRADVFVFLDAVAYPKSGNSMGSWVNRVRIAVNGQAVWIRVPAVREHGAQPINRVRIDNSSPWRDILLRTLEINYRRAPHFAACMSLIEPLIRNENDLLAEYNINAVTRIAAALELKPQLLRQSELSANGHGTELLVDLVRACGAGCYLSGDGADGYQENELFERSGIWLEKLNFSPRSYTTGAFLIPRLSVIDFLMHCEPSSFHRLISPDGQSAN